MGYDVVTWFGADPLYAGQPHPWLGWRAVVVDAGTGLELHTTSGSATERDALDAAVGWICVQHYLGRQP